GSPDYFHSCATNAQVSVPNNHAGTQAAATGEAYVGIVLIFPGEYEFREYIQSELIEPLNKDEHYKVSFKYSLGERSTHSTDDFGIHFSDVLVTSDSTIEALDLTPQLSSNQLLDNLTGWETITLDYIADGTEKFITMGNFRDDAQTSIVYIKEDDYYVSYIYLDDLEIVSCGKVEFGNDTSLCEGETIVLDASNEDATYVWQDNSTNSFLQVDEPGTYWVEVTTNCTLRDTISIEPEAAPVINLGEDGIICSGDTLILDAFVPNSTFHWQDNSVDPMLEITHGGSYWVEVTNKCGSVADSVDFLSDFVPMVDLGDQIALCPGDIVTVNAGNTGALFNWQDNSTSGTFSISQPGVYWVEATTLCGTDTDSVTANLVQPPLVSFGMDTTLCTKQTLLLDATSDFAHYVWQDQSTGPVLTVNDSGVYWVEVVNACGTSSDSITVIKDDCECLYLPNVFSPNDDGHNDTFAPVFKCHVEEYSFTIYDRWGARLYTTNDLDDAWDGYVNGHLAFSAVYILGVTYKFPNEDPVTTYADVTLIR
ncbi:MAG: gliding motility-associated C-terminal domain-containing protein, partial [Saprospiraceae bacterium]